MLRSLVSGAKKLAAGGAAGAQPLDLFPKVQPDVDGEDCLRDCESCSIHYPKSFKIEENDELYGHVKGWATHVLVATGKSDWVRDVADEKGSVMQAIERAEKPSNGVSANTELLCPWSGLVWSGLDLWSCRRSTNNVVAIVTALQRLMLSASNMPTPHHTDDYSEPTTVLLLPAFTIIENVTPASVSTLVSEYINKSPTNDATLVPVYDALPRSVLPMTPETSPEPAANLHALTSRPSPHGALVLLCSQRTRDARCGQSAPLLRKELERHLRPLGLFRDLDDERPGGVGIYFISHTGGHKYSANVMVYRRPDAFGVDGVNRAELKEGEVLMPRRKKDAAEGDGAEELENGVDDVGAAQCIWLARVKPEDIEGLVKYTILQGKVVKPERQLRGGFDRSKGLLSW